jgi:hypothetical protein
MPDFNSRWVEIARYSDEAVNRARAIRQENPSMSFEQALTQAQQELGGAQFTEGNHMEADPNNIKLRDRAIVIHAANPSLQFGEALLRARAERGPQFSEGTPVDPQSIEILRRTREIAEEHPSMRFGEALCQARLEIEAS